MITIISHQNLILSKHSPYFRITSHLIHYLQGSGCTMISRFHTSNGQLHQSHGRIRTKHQVCKLERYLENDPNLTKTLAQKRICVQFPISPCKPTVTGSATGRRGPLRNSGTGGRWKAMCQRYHSAASARVFTIMFPIVPFRDNERCFITNHT